MVSIPRLALICYTGLLFLGTHIPLNHPPRSTPDSWLGSLVDSVTRIGHGMRFGNRDKLIHFAAYAVLTLLAFWAAASYPRIRDHLSRSLFCAVGLVLLGALMTWGLFDEATQPFFGRSFQWYDYLANVIGIGTSTLAIAAAFALRTQSPRSPAMVEAGR